MAEAISVAIGVNAGVSAMRIVVDSTGEWGGFLPRALQVARFRRLVDNNSALGFSRNLNREKYATTPIIQAMYNCDDNGAISVAMVPAALGKTTAAMFFLRHNKSSVRGIAICRAQKGSPYVMDMLKLLGLSTTNPPGGWLSCLIDALQFPLAGDTRRSCLILDEFVNETSDRVDSCLVEELNTFVRNTKIRVILLTSSEPYANFLLTRNDLQGILPLNGTYPLDQYPNGHWQSMRWSVDTLKIAARQWPDFSEFTANQINKEIDEHISTLTSTDIRKLSFLKVVKAIEKKLVLEVVLQRLDVTASTSLDAEDPGCTSCTIA